MKIKIMLFVGIFMFVAQSCDRKKVYDRYEKLENHTWKAENILTHDVNIQDTLSANNVFLNIRHSNDYPYRNMFMFISITDPSGQFKKDTVEVFLADEKGKWFGSGIGDVFQNKIPLLVNVRFQHQGVYTFEIEQAMRQNQLPGVLDIGLRIEKVKSKK